MDGLSLFTRSVPSDDVTANAICQLMVDGGVTQLGIVYLDEEYGSGFRDALGALW